MSEGMGCVIYLQQCRFGAMRMLLVRAISIPAVFLRLHVNDRPDLCARYTWYQASS